MNARAQDPTLIADLAQRWSRARRAALLGVIGSGQSGDADDELSLLARALGADASEAYRRVFDNSLRLGKGFAQVSGGELPLGALPDLLLELGSPCLQGEWSASEDEPALFLTRSGCAMVGACDYWREAIDGLVLGLTGGIRHTRHHSVGHGSSACTDAIYVDPQSALRFGALPDDIKPGLERVRATARRFDSSVDVRFLGVSEGVLLYQLVKSGCGGELDVAAVVEKGLRKRFPELALREISPRPVLDANA